MLSTLITIIQFHVDCPLNINTVHCSLLTNTAVHGRLLADNHHK